MTHFLVMQDKHSRDTGGIWLFGLPNSSQKCCILHIIILLHIIVIIVRNQDTIMPCTVVFERLEGPPHLSQTQPDCMCTSNTITGTVCRLSISTLYLTLGTVQYNCRLLRLDPQCSSIEEVVQWSLELQIFLADRILF